MSDLLSTLFNFLYKKINLTLLETIRLFGISLYIKYYYLILVGGACMVLFNIPIKITKVLISQLYYSMNKFGQFIKRY